VEGTSRVTVEGTVLEDVRRTWGKPWNISD